MQAYSKHSPDRLLHFMLSAWIHWRVRNKRNTNKTDIIAILLIVGEIAGLGISIQLYLPASQNQTKIKQGKKKKKRYCTVYWKIICGIFLVKGKNNSVLGEDLHQSEDSGSSIFCKQLPNNLVALKKPQHFILLSVWKPTGWDTDICSNRSWNMSGQ